MEKIRSDTSYRPTVIGPVSPHLHARACALLDLPVGSPITEADMHRAAQIELDRMTPEQRAAHDEAMWRLIGPLL